MVAFLTPDQITAATRDVEARRAARQAKAGTAEGSAKPAASPGLHPLDIQVGPPPLNESEIAAAVASYRATYVNYDNPEIIELMEGRLREALAKDGHKLAPMPPEDKLKLLRARHRVR